MTIQVTITSSDDYVIESGVVPVADIDELQEIVNEMRHGWYVQHTLDTDADGNLQIVGFDCVGTPGAPKKPKRRVVATIVAEGAKVADIGHTVGPGDAADGHLLSRVGKKRLFRFDVSQD